MLMPSTGAVPSRTSSAARRIVPSPPSTIASSMSSTGTSTPSVATCPSRASASPSSSRSSGDSTGRAPASRRADDHALRGGDGVVAARVHDDQDVAFGVGHGLPVSRFTVLNHSVGLLPRPAPSPRFRKCAMNSALPCVPAIGEETTPQVPEPRVPRRPQHPGDGIGTGCGIRHESALDRGATDFELRLHQQHEVGVCGGHRACGRQHVRERDERQIAGDELRGRRRRRSPRARFSGVM